MPKNLAACSATLAESVDRYVTPYSLAAVAAGVSLLALAPPARGEVVITRKTIPIVPNTYPPVGIDFNHDGINDFSANLNYSAYPLSDWDLFVAPAQGWGAGAIVTSNKYPAPSRQAHRSDHPLISVPAAGSRLFTASTTPTRTTTAEYCKEIGGIIHAAAISASGS